MKQLNIYTTLIIFTINLLIIKSITWKKKNPSVTNGIEKHQIPFEKLERDIFVWKITEMINQ